MLHYWLPCFTPLPPFSTCNAELLAYWNHKSFFLCVRRLVLTLKSTKFHAGHFVKSRPSNQRKRKKKVKHHLFDHNWLIYTSRFSPLLFNWSILVCLPQFCLLDFSFLIDRSFDWHGLPNFSLTHASTRFVPTSVICVLVFCKVYSGKSEKSETFSFILHNKNQSKQKRVESNFEIISPLPPLPPPPLVLPFI